MGENLAGDDVNQPTDRQAQIQIALRQFLADNASGRPVSEESFLRDHKDLHPELQRELAKVRRILKAAPGQPNESREQSIKLECGEDTELFDHLKVLIGSNFADGGPASSPSRFPHIPGYQISGRVAPPGGQAFVYEAIQESTTQKVAIKVLRNGQFSSTRERERFDREAKILARLKHPYIVSIIDRGEAPDGLPYIVMELVDGLPIDRYVDKRFGDIESHDFDPSVVLRLFFKIGAAVHAAHERGVVHRDLKPSNILIDRHGTPRLLDFGLAKPVFDVSQQTVDGAFLGSLPWASPEQARGDNSKIDPRTDVYSLGVILYQMLTGGKFPYEVYGNMRDVMDNIITAPPTPLSSVGSVTSKHSAVSDHDAVSDSNLINGTIESIVLKALEKEPALRYQSVAALCEDVRSYLQGQPTDSSQASARLIPNRTSKSRDRRLIAGAGIVAILLIAIPVGFMTWYFFGRTRELVRSDLERGDDSQVASEAEPATDVNQSNGAADKTEEDSAVQVEKSLVQSSGSTDTRKEIPTQTPVSSSASEIDQTMNEAKGDVSVSNAAPIPTPQRDPGIVTARRRAYLERFLKGLEGYVIDATLDEHAKSFPSSKKIRSPQSTRGMKAVYFADWACRQPYDSAKGTEKGKPYSKAFVDPRGILKQVSFYNKDGVLSDESGCATIRYWHDSKRRVTQEMFYAVDGQPAENGELVVVAFHAYDDEGRLVETRFYEIDGQPAEDRLGVHRRVYKDGPLDLEYRLNGSRRERWLPKLHAGKRMNAEAGWHPTLSSDGKEMYFGIGWTGARLVGETGISRVTWEGDRWSDPAPVIIDGQRLKGLRSSLSSDGKFLAFSYWKKSADDGEEVYHRLPNHGAADIYIAQRIEGKWQRIQNAGKQINRGNEELGVAFIPNTHSLCYVDTAQPRDRYESDLNIADPIGDEWVEPRPLGIRNVIEPTYGPDGNRLYCAARKKGEYGKGDIWMSELTELGWSRLINLGPEVNNHRANGHPAVGMDGKLMYFHCCCPWNIFVTGRSDSEMAIRHMADVFADGEQTIPPIAGKKKRPAFPMMDPPKFGK